MSLIDIREESKTDQDDIRRVTEFAFRDRSYADGDEQDVIDRLRASDALALSLVAVDNHELVGQITFSRAENNAGSSPWFALGPVSVTPSRQGEGIGSALIKDGLMRIEVMGALGCILTGNPDYYRRFGFELSPANVPKNESEEYFMLKLLGSRQTKGTFSFHHAFHGDV